MGRSSRWLAYVIPGVLALGWSGRHALKADESPPPSAAALDQAIARSVALLEKSTVEYREHRECFSCHHQAYPTFTLIEAGRRGFAVDRDNIETQLDWTAAHLRRGRKSYLAGRGQGGKVDTAGYALWTLEAGDRPRDEVTDAVVEYLLEWKKEKGHWPCSSDRPPSEASDVTTTYLAIRALRVFAGDEQTSRADERIYEGLDWMARQEPKDTEEAVFRLRTLTYGDDPDLATQAARQLIDLQREDGGWAQKPEMASDAYATGSALVALAETDQLSPTDMVYQRGIQFLIRTQQEDGSWHVVSRSRPFQKYFESGYPHGKDQFISITASSWATSALLYAKPAPGNSP